MRRVERMGIVGVACMVLVVAASNPGSASAKQKQDAETFRQDMRKLWEDHITWTRMVIVSTLAGLPDQSAATERLLQNQADIGNAVKPFYGDAAGVQLTGLLREHILIAADILQAAKTGDATGLQEGLARWYANGNDIAAFLNSANPEFWPLEEMQMMMKAHLDATLAEALARLSADWARDVAAYDQVHVQALEMADMLSAGVIQQFSKLFK